MILKVSICIHPQKSNRAVIISLPTFSDILENALLLLTVVSVAYFSVDDINMLAVNSTSTFMNKKYLIAAERQPSYS